MSEERIVTLVDDQIAELRRQAANAARRNKPTMWAYYLDIAESLTHWFAGVERSDEEYVDTLVALDGHVRFNAPLYPRPNDAARAWALGVYARRILRATGYRTIGVSLDWLHERASAWGE